MTNVFVTNLSFYRARFSIQSLFKTTPCQLKRQRENHTGDLASDSSHEYTVDRRSSTVVKKKSDNFDCASMQITSMEIFLVISKCWIKELLYTFTV